MPKITNYQCLICGTNPDQLSHHKSHLGTGKHNSNKQLKYFDLIKAGYSEIKANEKIKNLETFTSTQYCFINGKKIHIDEFGKNYEKYKNETIKDINDEELVYCNGKKVKPYFRHLNNSSSEMTEWHKEWQSHFDEYTEKTYKKISENQIKSRRTDVDLNDKQVIEFQHSYMTKDEANNRKNDYNILNKEIIWIIWGGKSVEVYNLENSGRVFLEFINDLWKYESYISYDFIYIDIDEKIYKIYPKYVKSNMIDIQKPVSKNDFINSLKEDTNLFTENINDISQTKLYVEQKGAGNGKTFGGVQLICNVDYEHYDTFIYLTKQHSARHIILTEIKDQINRGYLNDIEFNNDDIEYIENKKDDAHASKQDIIRYKFKNKDKRLIIGTFDSFIYSLADKNNVKKFVDKFLAMVNNIIDSEKIRCSKNGTFKYARGTLKLNKKTLLVGDEIQDLHVNYMKAIFRIMLDHYVDFYVVGDKLQSISMEKNAFTFLENDIPIKDVIKLEPVNKCRRFSHPKLINFVNDMINFDKFELPPIDLKNKEQLADPNPVVIFSGGTVYATDVEEIKINVEVKRIMKYYEIEVNTNNRNPNDFLIVTPFVKTNPLVEALNISIREFWENKNIEQITYCKYSFFHKSENGTSIDLSESDDLTRIVSIHSSKGDGRNVVFLIGFTEGGLKNYSHDTGNLIYESLLHVAMTRMKKKLYIRVEENGDDIHKRIQSYLNKNNDFKTVKPKLMISKFMKIDKLINDLDYNKIYEEIVKKSNYANIDNLLENNKKIIDMKHHNIRYITMIILSLLKVLDYEQKNEKFKLDDHHGQYYELLKNILESDIRHCRTTSEYYKILKSLENRESNRESDIRHCRTTSEYYKILKSLENRESNRESNNEIPIYQFKKNEGDYQKYFTKICKIIDNIKIFIQKFLDGKGDLNDFGYLDCVVLYHLIEITKNKTRADLPISELYDIIDIIYKLDKNENEIYTNNHYEKINLIHKIWNNIFKKYPTMNYLYNHRLILDGKNDRFILNDTITFIGYNKTDVILFLFKPQFNEINLQETLKESLIKTFLVENIKKLDKNSEISNNYIKFNNKKVSTFIITLDSELEEQYIIDWKVLIKNNDNIIKDILKNNMISRYRTENNDVWLFYKYWRYNTKNEKPKLSIDKIVEEYKNVKNSGYPEYIYEFLINIKNQICYSKKKKTLIKFYDDENNFKEELDQYTEKAIEYYFGIFSEDEDDEDSEDCEDSKKIKII